MKVIFRAVPTLETARIWPEAHRVLAPALERPGLAGLYSPGHWQSRLAHEQNQLWVIETEGKITTACLTQIEVYPLARVMRIVATAGQGFDLWPQLFDDVERWARSERCRFIRCDGRDGWERLMRESGLRKIGVVYSKELIA